MEPAAALGVGSSVTPQPRPPPHALPRARKRFGQHFLTDASVLADIARRVAAQPGDVVLEVGPGRGALTVPLLAGGGRLVAVEIDRDLCAHLRQRFGEAAPGGAGLHLIEGDVLDLDLGQLLRDEGGQALVVVANLPYNITAPVLLRLRQHAALVRRAVLTLQKEVAERLVAPPGNRTYGQLSVLLGQCARLRIGREIPSAAFKPRPKVDSAVLEIDFEPQRVPVADLRALEAVVRAAFGQRRKMLRNALQALPGADGGPFGVAGLAALAAAADIDLTRRAEDLSIGQFARLADAFAAAGAKA